jgi:tetratricopeptide (TPR) repeat protein
MRQLLVALILLGSAGAHAQSQTVEDARRLYLAGRQAYEAGRLEVAAASFEAAYGQQPRPALLWNLGQTYRRLFIVHQQLEQLRRAVDSYRGYLLGSPGGENRDEATRLLADLTPLLLRMDPDHVGAAPAPPAASPAQTELMIVADAEQATVELDNRPATPAPLLAEVSAGEHRARVAGPGYVPVELKVQAVAGRLITSEARLSPLPASVDVRGPAGAQLLVDQQAVGRLPRNPLQLTPGAHVVTLLANGRKPWQTPLALARGAQVAVTAHLRPTSQRRAVPWLLGLASAAAVVSIPLGAVWGKSEADADKLATTLHNSGLTLAQASAYQSDRARLDQFRVATIVTLSLTVALAATTGALYVFDQPKMTDAN